MRPCNDIVPLLGPLLDGELPDDDREFVEDHLRGCARCQTRRALLAAQGDGLREVLAGRAAAADFTGFTDGVMARVARETPLRAAERRRVWGREMWGAHKRAFTAIGSMAVAASVAGLVLLTPPGGVVDEPSGLSAQVDEVDFGSREGAVLELPHDTTVIWLSEDKQ